MHISELHVFQKNTDATAALRGYKYQELRTLETWLANRVQDLDDHIYCDFEEDIFQRNLVDFKSTFRQIKLYNSKNFSFASEEVRKAISHFFMLFTKGDYLLDEIAFTFETNSSIANSYKGNDADLLKNWNTNQENISSKLLEQIIEKLQEIVFNYLEDSIKSEKNDAIRAQKEQKKENLKGVPNEIWIAFTKSIRWMFIEVSSEQEIEDCTARIFDLISQLPFPITSEDYNIVFSTLLRTVGEKSINSAPADRVLTKELVDNLLLNLSDDGDKKYNQIYNEWKDVEHIEGFIVGEFYEVLSSAKYCARNKYLENHSDLWLNFIKEYIEKDFITKMFKSHAIYEFIWLSLRPQFGSNVMNSIEGFEYLIIEFFEISSKNKRLIDFEHQLNLINLLVPAIKLRKVELKEEVLKQWQNDFLVNIDLEIASTSSSSRLCALHELKAFFQFNQHLFDKTHNWLKDVEESFSKILKYLPEAKQFSVSQLGNRVDSVVGVLIKFNGEQEEIKAFEDFGNALIPFVAEREGDFSMAKRYSQMGISFLDTTESKDILKSLDYLHKAKNLWYKEETVEGFLLAVINISQLYLAIGMYSAAKYYAMGAAWYAMIQDDPNNYKRTSQAMGMALHSDILQGAWMSALDGFKVYAWSWIQFSSHITDSNMNEDFWKPIFDGATVLLESERKSPQLSGFLYYYKNGEMKAFHDEYIEPIYEELSKRQSELGGINAMLKRSPLSDIGPTRFIEWKALGSTWIVKFENSYLNSLLAEEFVAMFQILLTEIALTQTDLLLAPNIIYINVKVGDRLTVEEELSSKKMEWNIYLTKLEDSKKESIHKNNSQMISKIWSILNEISLYPQEELMTFLEKLMAEQGLLDKIFVLNSYQNIYEALIPKADFEVSQRENFTEHTEKIEYNSSPALELSDSLSTKYDKAESLEYIKNTYSKSNELINITLAKLKKQQAFIQLVKNLKSEGWLDWQILMALMNTITNIKVKKAFGATKPSDKEYHEKLIEISKIPESENFQEISFDEISKDFSVFRDTTSIQVLRRYGLQNKMRKYSDTSIITDILNSKFNYHIDDLPELSPLKDV